jgi:tRNA-binding protein
MNKQITWEEFENVDIRVGTIVEVNDFPEAKIPAYKIKVDFGSEIGIKRSSARVTDLYSKDELINKKIIGVVNFPPKKIGPFISEFLCAGFYREDGTVVLAVPDKDTPVGSKLG